MQEDVMIGTQMTHIWHIEAGLLNASKRIYLILG